MTADPEEALREVEREIIARRPEHAIEPSLDRIRALVSLLSERPLTLSAAQTWRPRQARRLAELYKGEPAARRAFRASALGWGIGLLGEAVLRVPLVFLLPVDVMVGLSTAMMIAAMAGLAVWNAA